MKVCEKGHYYDGDECPYCPINTDDKRTIQYPLNRGGNSNIPTCSHCGKPIRKRVNLRHESGVVVGSVGNCHDGRVPWNYAWNGRCDYCGHDYNISIRQKLGNSFDLGDKHTFIRIAYKSYMYSCTGDISIDLSGVEVETFVKGHAGDKQKQKVFLSTNELKYLLKVLSNSPILQQEDSESEYDRWRMCEDTKSM